MYDRSLQRQVCLVVMCLIWVMSGIDMSVSPVTIVYVFLYNTPGETTFYKEVQRLVGDKASYVRPLTQGPPLIMLMYPGDASDFIISKCSFQNQKIMRTMM